MPKSQTKDSRNIIITSSEVAKLFGLGVRRVQQLAKQGVINNVKVGRLKKFELYPTVQLYIKHLKEKIEGKESKKDANSKSRKFDAEASLKESKAKIAELELRELKGMLHRSEDVEAVITDLVFNIRSMLVALPGRLAIDVANIKTAAEASELIKLECYHILNELVNYKYNPDEYRRRVRERKGWNVEDNDSEEES